MGYFYYLKILYYAVIALITLIYYKTYVNYILNLFIHKYANCIGLSYKDILSVIRSLKYKEACKLNYCQYE